MGSEHYCLRWNNHQSNLLGVFSQLLQDESLVDVTLACSEGASIRAHKVVLSACSSYFQSLFLDHPEKHPIVILKDVRLAELQTLVEFMYKGEVNVQYCQLSALLKTAESLKVKGLAEMTNQNTTLREPEREPDRLRPHSQTSKPACDSPVDTALGQQQSGPSTSATSASATTESSTAAAAASAASAAAAATSSATTPPTTSTFSQTQTHKREPSDSRCSPPPSKRHHHQSAAAATGSSTAPIKSDHEDSPQPLDLYQRRPTIATTAATSCSGTAAATNANTSTASSSSHTLKRSASERDAAADEAAGDSHDNSSVAGSKTPPSKSALAATGHSHNNGDDHREHLMMDSPHDRSEACCLSLEGAVGGGGVEKIEDIDDYDEEMDLDEEEECDNSSSDMGHMGLNMKIGCGSSVISHPMVGITSPLGITNSGGGLASAVLASADPESARSTPHAATTSSTGCLPSDLTQRPASRNSRDGAERPSSSGLVVCGPPSISAGSLSGGMSPTSSAAMAAAAAAAAEALGPVQSVPLSLKKEIDCSEDDNSNSHHSRSHIMPRSASAGVGGDLDYRGPLTHESETSELSPHGVVGAMAGGGGGGNSATHGASTSSSSSNPHEQLQQQQHQHTPHTHTSHSHHSPQTPPPMYPCVYCGAPFPTQNKLTRHILSHSLKTLEYRETATSHALLHQHLLQPELNMTSITHQLYQMNALVASSGADPQEQAALAIAFEKDFAAFASAIPGLDLEGVAALAAASSSSSRRSDGGGGSSGNGGLGGSSSASGLLLSGGPGSSSASSSAAVAAAAAAAAAAASSPSSSSAALLAASSDPNGGVLCKFCGKSFPDVASLISHLPVHTGDRPFKCEFCGKAFKLRHHMKDHCRVHTGERPFRCSMCGKTFSRSTILKAHEKTHFPKYVRKFLSPSPVDTKDELPQ